MIAKGTRFGPYEVVEKIGQGGMGVVYRAREPRLQRDVALKILPDRLATNPGFTKRFIREAQAAARIEHPGIVSIYGVGEHKGSYWLAMQLVSGKPLSQLMGAGPMEPKMALDIVRQAAEALDYAHGKGVTHRDIKPDNIMIDDAGRVKIMDFGLAKAEVFDAKITESGVYLGTPEYSSPEQCESQDVDGRSDLYSLGVVLYEALTGQVPHSAETPYSLFKKIVDEKPVPIRDINPEVPASVVALVDKLMEKDRDRRYQSAREVAGDILKIVGLPATGVSDGADTAFLGAPGSNGARNPWPLVGLLGAASLAFAGLVLLLFASFGDKAPEEAGPMPPAPAPVPAPAPGPAEPDERPVVALVLDFENPTGSRELDWMRIGVPDMLITDLAQMGWLKVHSRERVLSSMKKLELETLGAPEDLDRLGALLGADILVNGRFVEMGGKVKITIHVLTQPDDDLILSDHITGTLDEILTMVDELTRRIRRGLVARFRPDQAEPEILGKEIASLESQIVEVAAVGAVARRRAQDKAPVLVEEVESLKILVSRLERKLQKRQRGTEDLLVAEEHKALDGRAAASGDAPASRSGYASEEARKVNAQSKGKDLDDAAPAKDAPGAPPAPAATPSPAPAPGAGLAGRPAEPAPSSADPAEGGSWAGETQDEKEKALPGKPEAPGDSASDDEPAAESEAAEEVERLDRGRRELRLKESQKKGEAAEHVAPAQDPTIRALALSYRARSLRELGGDDPEILLQATALLQEALRLDPRLKIAKAELQALAERMDAQQD